MNYFSFDDRIVVQTKEMGKVQVRTIPDLDLKVGQKVRFLITPEILESYPPIVTPLYFEIIN